jgi:hypothetical protein
MVTHAVAANCTFISSHAPTINCRRPIELLRCSSFSLCDFGSIIVLLLSKSCYTSFTGKHAVLYSLSFKDVLLIECPSYRFGFGRMPRAEMGLIGGLQNVDGLDPITHQAMANNMFAPSKLDRLLEKVAPPLAPILPDV